MGYPLSGLITIQKWFSDFVTLNMEKQLVMLMKPTGSVTLRASCSAQLHKCIKPRSLVRSASRIYVRAFSRHVCSSNGVLSNGMS